MSPTNVAESLNNVLEYSNGGFLLAITLRNALVIIAAVTCPYNFSVLALVVNVTYIAVVFEKKKCICTCVT